MVDQSLPRDLVGLPTEELLNHARRIIDLSPLVYVDTGLQKVLNDGQTAVIDLGDYESTPVPCGGGLNLLGKDAYVHPRMVDGNHASYVPIPIPVLIRGFPDLHGVIIGIGGQSLHLLVFSSAGIDPDDVFRVVLGLIVDLPTPTLVPVEVDGLVFLQRKSACNETLVLGRV